MYAGTCCLATLCTSFSRHLPCRPSMALHLPPRPFEDARHPPAHHSPLPPPLSTTTTHDRWRFDHSPSSSPRPMATSPRGLLTHLRVSTSPVPPTPTAHAASSPGPCIPDNARPADSHSPATGEQPPRGLANGLAPVAFPPHCDRCRHPPHKPRVSADRNSAPAPAMAASGGPIAVFVFR